MTEASASPACAICQSPAGANRPIVTCTKCGAFFCWPPADKRHPCGYRRDNTTDIDTAMRVDFRCVHCAGLVWRRFGADLGELRTPLLVIAAYVLACAGLWFGIIHLVTWIESLLGIA